MKKFFTNVVEWWADWQKRRKQREIEQRLEKLLDLMLDATRQVHEHRYDTLYSGRKDFFEAVAVIETSDSIMKESLPLCSLEFQIQVTAQRKMIRHLLTAAL